MHTDTAPTRGLTSRKMWRLAVTALLGLASAFFVAGLALPPAPAQAADLAVNQCNNIGPSPLGATTGMTCNVTVVNTIDGGTVGSVTTVTRLCTLGECPPGNGTFTTTSTSLVTSVTQCNDSGNDAAHRTDCDVRITNNISADTPGAVPVTPGTVNQCVGSAGGGGGSVVCSPFPANTTGATVTQCNGSANGGGGTIDCEVGELTVSAAIPITVNQCNGTGNPGGSVVSCSTTITTVITPAASPTVTPTDSAGPTPTDTVSPSPTGVVPPLPTETGVVPPLPTETGVVPPLPNPTGEISPTLPGTVTPTLPGTVTPTPTGSVSPTPSSSPSTAPAPTVAPGTGTGVGPQVPRVPSGGVDAGGGSTAGGGNVGLMTLGSGMLLAAALMVLFRARVIRPTELHRGRG